MDAWMLKLGVIAVMGTLAPLAAAQPSSAVGAPLPGVGVVVDWHASSHTATLALAGGRLVAVHTTSLARVGTRVHLSTVTRLANGTYRGRLRPFGRATHARVRGMLVARLGHGAVALSTRGSTLTVRLTRGHRRTHRAMEISGVPPIGAVVTTTVEFDRHGDLSAGDLSQTAPPAAGEQIDLEGTLTNIDATGRVLTLTNVDDGVSAQFIVHVPDTFDLGAYTVGQELCVSVTVDPDGQSYTLAGSSENEDGQQADDQAGEQGDIADAPDNVDGSGDSTTTTATGGF